MYVTGPVFRSSACSLRNAVTYLFAITKSGVEDDKFILHVCGRHGHKENNNLYT